MDDSLAPVKDYLREFYFSNNLHRLLEEPRSLPSPLNLAEVPGLAEFTAPRLARDLVWFDEQDAAQPPLLAETLERHPGVFLGVRFHTPHRHGVDEETHEFSVLLDTGMNLDLLVKRFFLPLVLEFLRAEENAALRADLQAKWLLAVQTYNSKLKEASDLQGIKAESMEEVLASGQVADRTFAYSILYILSELLQFLRANQDSNDRFALMVRNPLIYQSIRFLYAHTLAVREDLVKKNRQAAERKADQDAAVRHLTLVPRPVSLAELGLCKDAAGGLTLVEKYASVRDLLPLVPTKESPVPLVLGIDGDYLHRWHLVRHCLHARSEEAARILGLLVESWTKTGVPAEGAWSFPPNLVSEPFLSSLKLFCQWRVAVRDKKLFAQQFLPPEHSTELLVQLDHLVFADMNTLTRRPLEQVLEISYPQVAARAWAELLHREGPFRYLMFRLLALFGRRPASTKGGSAPPAPKKGVAVSRRPASGPKPLPRASRPAAPTRKPAPPPKAPGAENSQTALFQLLKGISDIDGEIEDLHRRWNTKTGPSVAVFRSKVDGTIAGDLASRFTFASLTADQAETLALGLISKTRYLCEVPKPKHRFLARYVFLVALRQRLQSL